MTIKWIGASDSNYTKGRDGNQVEFIVVHWMVGTLEGTGKWFNDGRRNVSAHYGIGDDEIHQYVRDEDTAWHAGDWEANTKSIGIEHEGGPDIPITDATYETSAKLIKELSEKYNISIDREHIKPHNEFRATQCPGTLDIDRLIDLAEGTDDCQDKIEALEDEIAEISQERDRKDRKLEECRDDRTQNKAEYQEHIEEIQSTLTKSQKLNDDLRIELQNRTEERDKLEGKVEPLEQQVSGLKEGLEALEKVLRNERADYSILEEKYIAERLKVDDLVQNMSILEFIIRKWRR